jgi:DNA-binding transcriptional ArsR family regulator
MTLDRPIATQTSTLQAILDEAGRPGKVPIRKGFVQRGDRRAPKPGPLATIVARGRNRALDQYLIGLALASSGPWDVRRDSRIWARALGLSADDSGRSAISRNWAFLQELDLVRVERKQRLARVTFLREDGSGALYEHHPSQDRKPAYLTIPFAYWTDGWFKSLSLPAKAMLLIARDVPDHSPLPSERMPTWYGISERTARRGLRELREAGLVAVSKEFKEAPLAPEGYTAVNYYTLQPPVGPKANEAPEVVVRP